ncbi:MAG: NADP-dependent oxidoreductase [Proteobacteria bacterium]|nr:NADP-dependent oxidoreductase [Pseudomonadota bacterium]
MKAIVLTAFGDVNKLIVEELPDPSPGPNQIKVRMAGAGINPVDWKLRSGALQKMMPLALPAVLGRDASGVVVAVGPGVTAFEVGARVMGLVMAGYADFVVAPVEAWAAVPPAMDLVDAAALPLILLTGAQLIEEAVKPARGDVVLVTGALGSVGRVTVFVAQQHGAKVWAGVRGTQKAQATSLGVDGVVALDDDAEVAALPLLDGLADTIGGPALAKVLLRMKSGATIGSVVGEPAGAKQLGLVTRAIWTHPDAKRLAELGRDVAEGRLVIPIAKRLPLARAGEAQTLAEHHAGGKVILIGASAAAR